MSHWDAVYAFLAAAAIAALLTPLAAKLARLVGAIARPSERGLARNPTPLLGGLAIFIAFLVGAIVWMPSVVQLKPPAHAASSYAGTVHVWALIAGAALIVFVGAVDDVRDLPPIVKLVGQIVAAVIAVRGGATINDLTIPFVGSFQFTHAGGAITVVWLVALMNIVNFSDGVDGLAAGVCAIDGVAFALIAFNLQGHSAAAMLAAITAGGSLGFLVHNFPPAKVFMGDAGSNLLGYLLGLAAILGSLKTTSVVALAIPLLILAVPFLDTGFVVAKRLKYRRKPWSADDYHFHHRMAKIGFSQRKTVAYLYAWTLMLAGVAVALRFVPYDPHHDGHYRLGWSILMGAILLAGLAASVYLVYVLEIFKFKAWRTIQIRRADPDSSDEEIERSAERDVETGEFDAVRH